MCFTMRLHTDVGRHGSRLGGGRHKGSAQQWKVAVENNYALHPVVLLAGAEVCLNVCNRIKNSLKIDTFFMLNSENVNIKSLIPRVTLRM